MRFTLRSSAQAAALVAIAVSAVAAPLHAQSGDGFLFGQPRGSITLRGGFSHAQASSDLFDELTQNLTLRKSDFSGATGGAEFAARVAPNVDLTFDAGYMSTSTPSHYRNLVDTQNREIQQTTALQRVPATVNAKLYVVPRGRSIGQFAWIPNSVSPWVGAGAGLMWYRFRQDGDFVDTSTLNVRHDTFVSDGWTAMAQGMAGVDLSLTPRLAITGDARYLLTRRPQLSSDFQGYQPLDLSGIALSLGLTVRL